MTNDHLDDDTLQALAEGTLDGKAAAAARAHLDACPACRDETTAYRDLFRVLEAEGPPAPASLAGAVLAAIQRQGAAVPRGVRARWKVAGLAAAAAALFLALGFLDAPAEGVTLVPALTERVGEGLEKAVPVPSGLGETADRATAWATRGFTTLSSRTRALVTDRAALSGPLAAVLALCAALQLAAFWRLRRDAP